MGLQEKQDHLLFLLNVIHVFIQELGSGHSTESFLIVQLEHWLILVLHVP